MDAKALPQINLKLVSPKVRAERRQRHILFTGQGDVERAFERFGVSNTEDTGQILDFDRGSSTEDRVNLEILPTSSKDTRTGAHGTFAGVVAL
jgi:hypothetical protein